jgi:DNA/RNA-binding domain of Phe-tRNA-synthetase-like protein
VEAAGVMGDEGPRFAEAAVDPTVAGELPGLRLWETRVAGGTGRTEPGVRERLEHLSRRMNGAQAVLARTRPIPQAYRRLFRHIGLDPDTDRIPQEAAIVERLRHGRYRPDNRLDDALLVAVVETGVPLWALDDELVAGELELRPARAGERLGDGEQADGLPPGRLIVADDRGAVAVLFGRLAPSHRVTAATTAMRLFSVQAPGVPQIHVSEALWTCLECLSEGAPGVD